MSQAKVKVIISVRGGVAEYEVIGDSSLVEVELIDYDNLDEEEA